jgi:hypothetical protein
LNIKKSRYIASAGLLLNASALLLSTLFGFGGFSMKAFSGYIITGYVSRLQLVFLFLVGVGLIISGIGYTHYIKKQKIKNPNYVLLLYLAVSSVFFVLAFFGLTSQFRGTDFWGETSFEGIRNTLLFNSLTLTSFLALGTLQIFLSIILFKTKMLRQHQLSKIAKTLTLTSGILLIIKTIIDYPILKESIFVLSYMLKIPSPNNILSIVAPIIYLSTQIVISLILMRNQKSSTSK